MPPRLKGVSREGQSYSLSPYFRLQRPQGTYRVLTSDSAYTTVTPPLQQQYLLVRDDREDSSGQLR